MSETQEAIDKGKQAIAEARTKAQSDRPDREYIDRAVRDGIAEMKKAEKAEAEKALADQRNKEFEALKAENDRLKAGRKIRFGMDSPEAVGMTPEQQLRDDSIKMAAAVMAHRGVTTHENACKSLEHMRLKGQAMAGSATGYGAEWLRVGYSNTLIERVQLASLVAGIIPNMPMPDRTLTIPRYAGRPAVVKLTEPTADNASNMASTVSGTDNVTYISVSAGGVIWVSKDLTDDALVQMIEFESREAINAVARVQDQFITDGANTGAHFDDDVTSSTDLRKSYAGMIDHAITGGFTRSLATFSTANLILLKTDMAKYGVLPSDLAFIIGIKTYGKFLGLTETMTVDKFGPQATVLNGELGKLLGIPIIVSETMREDVAASGVHDGTSVENQGRLLLIYRPGWVLGVRKELFVEIYSSSLTDQDAVIFKMRKAYGPRFAATEQIAALGKGITF